jgi:hypothetical protein
MPYWLQYYVMPCTRPVDARTRLLIKNDSRLGVIHGSVTVLMWSKHANPTDHIPNTQ